MIRSESLCLIDIILLLSIDTVSWNKMIIIDFTGYCMGCLFGLVDPFILILSTVSVYMVGLWRQGGYLVILAGWVVGASKSNYNSYNVYFRMCFSHQVGLWAVSQEMFLFPDCILRNIQPENIKC